jgi:hypothetical protein
MTIDLEYFVDSHCHLFTMADIPLYQTVRQFSRENGNLPKRMLLPLVSFLLPLINPEKKVEQLETFMRFFENEPQESVRQLTDEVLSVIDAKGAGGFSFTARKTVLTPLIMDFEMDGGKKLEHQVNRLLGAIEAVKPDRVQILPFLGIDPRRSDLSDWLPKVKSVRQRLGEGTLESGHLVGIKLYPPLGFRARDFRDGYQRIAEQELPVTVHCQKDSLNLVGKAGKLTEPTNWKAVLENMHGQPPLRINFAHFGGDAGVADTVVFRDRSDAETGPLRKFERLSTNSWTYEIIRLLKRYEHTYADLSAFNFAEPECAARLLWILHFDEEGQFRKEGSYKLADKLLWGSDYPMTLTARGTTYTTIFQDFVDAFKMRQDDLIEYPEMPSFGPDAFLRKLLCDNPKKFLGLPDPTNPSP